MTTKTEFINKWKCWWMRFKNREPDVIGSCRQFLEADTLREISREIYGGTWLADSQVRKLKEDIARLYDFEADADKLSRNHLQYQQRLNILKKWLERSVCGRCGWRGPHHDHCPDCGAEVKARYIPLPSSGYWNPEQDTYFTRGFGVTKAWWRDNQKKNVNAKVKSILKIITADRKIDT